jgi:4-diphosphocytidyl-2-C-methyl-D-erythritol kinase
MVTFPRAKINFGLRITGRRHDGFHDIESLFYPIDLSDALEFVTAGPKADKDTLDITGLPVPGRTDDNLVLRAVKMIREYHPIPFLKLHLHKVIPTGAGLGGGSSDASSVLKYINRYFNLCIPDAELLSLSAQLGSDCPFFINAVPSHVTGRGEKMKEIRPFLEGLYLVLLNPGISLSTREAYLNCHPVKPAKKLTDLIKRPADTWKKCIRNDFEDFAFRIYPEIGKLKTGLYKSGAMYASMTGSGSSVFGIFTGKPLLLPEYRKQLVYEGFL